MREGTLQITVFTKPGCQPCKAVKRWLDQKGVAFDAVDVAESPEGLEQVRALGYDGVPVTLVRDEAGAMVDHWHGYVRDSLVKYTAPAEVAA